MLNGDNSKMVRFYLWAIFSYILSKNKKYPGNSCYDLVNTDENSRLSDACLETWNAWLCSRVGHLDLCQ